MISSSVCFGVYSVGVHGGEEVCMFGFCFRESAYDLELEEEWPGVGIVGLLESSGFGLLGICLEAIFFMSLIFWAMYSFILGHFRTNAV